MMDVNFSTGHLTVFFQSRWMNRGNYSCLLPHRKRGIEGGWDKNSPGNTGELYMSVARCFHYNEDELVLMQIPVDKIVVYDPDEHQGPSAYDEDIGHEVGNESRFKVL
jgi:hypothetical protein